jgi:cytochrome d ubiquinol oxidase subunit I
MTLDPVLLSRLQWTWVVAWHILLPAFTLGLASYIAVLEGLYLLTGEEIWFRISGFWTRIFAVSFGMGVVSGIIMPFQFGTNWSRFTDAVAFGTLLSTFWILATNSWMQTPPGL